MNFWGKRIKKVKPLADALGVSEEKIQALKDNKLEIGGATMDKTLDAIEDTKIKSLIKENDIWRWVQDTDFKAKREEFGYATQKEVARLIGCDSSNICNLESNKGRFKKVTPILVKVYEFYTNDFNKKINGYKATKLRVKVDKDNKHIWRWYKNTNIRELRLSLGHKNLYELADKIGVSQSCLSDLERKNFKTLNKTIINAYNFYNQGVETPKDDVDTIYNWYVSIDDMPKYRREFGYSLNRFMASLNLSYDQVRCFERKEYKSASNVVKRAYDFYHNEDNRLPAIVWEPAENNAFVVQNDDTSSTTPSVDANVATQNDEILLLQNRIKHLELLNQDLQKQIERYEKLIDRL